MMEMRRKDKCMEQEAMLDVLKSTEYGVLSTIGEDGYPYGVPVNYAYDDGTIYIHGTGFMGHKNSNLSYSDKVCFNVVRNAEVLPSDFNSRFESVVVFGSAKRADENKVKGLKLLIDKYSQDFQEAGMKYIEKALDKVLVYEIKVESMTGKAKY